MTEYTPLSESTAFPNVAQDWAKSVGILTSGGALPAHLKPSLNLSDLVDVPTAQTNLALVPGVNVQAFNGSLLSLAGASSVSAFTVGLLSIIDDAGYRSALGAGTVTSVNNLTINSTGTDISSSIANPNTNPTITLSVPTASATNRGLLSSANWTTFNNKQAALVSGTSIKTFNSVSILGSGNVTAVTSIDAAGGSTGLTFSGGPITGTGTLTLGGTLAVASGGTGVITLSALKTNMAFVKADVGLSNVDNTSDANKPISTATQTALNAKFTTANATTSTDGLMSAVDKTLLTASKTANYIFAAPNGSAGAPVFRALVAADIPTLNQSTTGNAATATALATSRTLSVAGDATGAVSFNGTADASISITLGTVVTAGTYRSVTVDAKGRVTAGTSPTTLAGYGITDAQVILVSAINIKTINGTSILGSGDISVGGSPFTTLSSTSTTNLGSGASVTTTIGTGSSSVVTIGSTTSTVKLSGTRLISFGADYTSSGTSGSKTIDWNNGQRQIQPQPVGSITYTAWTAPPGPCHLQLVIASNGSSTAQTFTFPSNCRWLGGTWIAENNKTGYISIDWDGTYYWLIGTNQV